MRRSILSFFMILIMIISSSTLAKMTLVIKGLSGPLNDNVNARLSQIDPNRVDNTHYFKQYLESQIKKSLRALGYYAPTFDYEVSEEKKQLIVTINKGDPILMETTDINILGEGAQDKDYQNLLKKDLPAKGTVLNHGDYDGFKKKLQNLALHKGYFEANMTKHQLLVAEHLHQAFWQIDFNTGERYKFGKVIFDNPVIRESYLQQIVPFKANTPYTSEQLSLLNRRISSTNWFSSVTVIPLFDKTSADKVLPLKVITVPKKKNNIDVGLGYSSDNGVRGKLGWSKPWLNDRGHSFQSNLALSSPEQFISGVYKIPLHKSPLEDYYTIQGGYKIIDNKDTDSKSYSFGVVRNWDTFKGWQRALGLNVLYDNFTQANDSYETFLLYPSFSFSRVRSDSNALPMWADSQRYSIEAATDKLASDINFVRFQIQQVWIRSLSDSHRFILRDNLGLIQANDFDRVPPSFRFFAGGDRSIRGYSYQSISPKDKENKLTGGSKLITGSLEYQYNIKDSWWSALFVDSGEAIGKLEHTNFHTGGGVGIRWASPIGPIKLDVATPLNKSGKSVHFYIGLGSEL